MRVVAWFLLLTTYGSHARQRADPGEPFVPRETTIVKARSEPW